jgi:hypothetical protein
MYHFAGCESQFSAGQRDGAQWRLRNPRIKFSTVLVEVKTALPFMLAATNERT